MEVHEMGNDIPDGGIICQTADDNANLNLDDNDNMNEAASEDSGDVFR